MARDHPYSERGVSGFGMQFIPCCSDPKEDHLPDIASTPECLAARADLAAEVERLTAENERLRVRVSELEDAADVNDFTISRLKREYGEDDC